MVTKLQLVSDRLSALLIALPLTSILAMIWMRHESKVSDQAARVESIANHAYYTFWYVIPTMPMFLLMPWMLRKGIHYGWSLLAGCVLTALLFVFTAWIMKRFGVELM